MKPLPEQIHVVTCAGTPENGFQAQRFQPMNHPSYVEAIAHYRLPPPHGWAVLHMTPADYVHPDSSVNKSLNKFERADGTGARSYLKAAVDDLFKTPEMADIIRNLYKVDFMQYPSGYPVEGDIKTVNLYSALESLDLLFIATKLNDGKQAWLDVQPTERGQLAAAALDVVYGTK